MAALPSSELGELAFRTIESGGPNAWLLIVSSADRIRLAAALSREIVDLGDESVVAVSVASPSELRETVRRPARILVITGVDSFSEEDWRQVDANRSQYQRDGVTVLVLDEGAVGRIERMAPNLASWIGGNIWSLRNPLPLDGAAAERRLDELRAWSGIGDAEVIRLAERGALPRDPPYAEWVVLLGRGDLLGS